MTYALTHMPTPHTHTTHTHTHTYHDYKNGKYGNKFGITEIMKLPVTLLKCRCIPKFQ
jgi:hypothetical protein